MMRNVVYGVRSFNHIGDSIITAGAVHNVKAAHPEALFRYVGHAPEMWMYNPDVTDRPVDVTLPKVCYESVEQERRANRGNVVEAFTATLCRLLGIPMVPLATRVPYAVLSDEERERAEQWRGAVLLNANGQTVSFSKAYPHWQEVVDGLCNDFPIVQVGSRERRNISPSLERVRDWRGKSENLRDFMAMVAGCAGVISPPSGIINIAAAFGKKAVIVNGARELDGLTAYPGMAHVSAFWPRCRSGKDWACIALTENGQRRCREVVTVRGERFAACMEALDPVAIVEAARRVLK